MPEPPKYRTTPRCTCGSVELEAVGAPIKKIGFEEDLDHSSGEEFRVVQLTPPGSACSTAMGTGIVDTSPGSVQGLQLVVPDIDAARGAPGAGVEVSEIRHFDGSAWRPGGGDWNSFVFFSDPDGNGWALQQSPGRG